MGASHTTLASASNNSEDGIPELTQGNLSAYVVDQALFPGSGRMMRTYRLRDKQKATTVVLKVVLVGKEHESVVADQEAELIRIRSALQGQPHVAPFLHWTLGQYRPRSNNHTMVRQISLIRPHLYTTLSDRLASRPFLTHVEKLWIVYQLLQALDAMHSKGVVHGFLTAENIGLSSWNWLVLTDLASYKARTALPDDDPTEYLYYFQENNQQGNETTPREKRCYLAPERFYTPNRESSHQQPAPQSPLTPAMDIFSAGCVILETFLNGERALDLGDLMEYRKQQQKTKTSPTLQQKLNKIEFSAIRAACRNMLHLDPEERLSASSYLERLQSPPTATPSGPSSTTPELVPSTCFSILAQMMERVTFAATPDARLAIATAYYSSLVWEAKGVRDLEGQRYVTSILGPTMSQMEESIMGISETTNRESIPTTAEATIAEEKKDDLLNADLFAETEALLKKLETLDFDNNANLATTGDEVSTITGSITDPAPMTKEKRSEMAQSSLLIYLQLILSTVRHVQRPSSKLVALQLMDRLAKHSSDEARLQRMLPVTVSLLQDQDPLVRASAIRVLTSTVSIIDSFPPSDSKIFPEYIFKRVAHMITDPSLVVRLAFAKSVASLAETSQRFLDIAHAVRLYEAVGGGNGGTGVGSVSHNKGKDSTAPSADTSQDGQDSASDVFADDVTKLLDESANPKDKKQKLRSHGSGMESTSSDGAASAGKTLISSTYTQELGVLHETVSRWVVHITTDQSEQSSPAKRALLSDMARLCNFFGLDGVMAFILPQILSFLNDRKDWQLRAALFDCLPSVCHIIGRAATEHFVLPCLEIALVDGEEQVISRALKCLSELISMGLLSRSLLLGTPAIVATDAIPGLLKKYGALLVHPSETVRYYAISTVNACCRALRHPDGEVFVVPILKPFLRFQPTTKHLTTREGLDVCLHPSWKRERFQEELDKTQALGNTLSSPTAGQWTSIAFRSDVDPSATGGQQGQLSEQEKAKQSIRERDEDSQSQQVRLYLKLLARSRTYHSKNDERGVTLRSHLKQCIEGSLKLSQQIKFPRQNIPGLPSAAVPEWYNTIRDVREQDDSNVSENVSIRSVSALGQVYGLSIMDQNAGTQSSNELSPEHASELLKSTESSKIEASCSGQWGSETCLDPTLTDTSLLVTKLNALQVPPLPPRLAKEKPTSPNKATPQARGMTKDSSSGPEWKLKIDTMVSTSRCTAEHGHVAPVVRLVVSQDQHFFATGSHDGRCRVWELEKAERSNGVMESSHTYSGHQEENKGSCRVNDLAIVEGGHSIVSGASNGSVHVWRVDMVSSMKQSPTSQYETREVSRVVGASEIRQVAPDEGEILAVNHFNTSSASILSYATQKGNVHSWDLRSAREPFALRIPNETGHITSMAMGSDRNWMVIGTSKGFLSLWDLRFQQILKLWHHSRAAPINRLATSFVPPPQSWVGRGSSNVESRPFLFAASGPNECGMFDMSTGVCRECFRTVDYGSRFSKSRLDDMPKLEEIPISVSSRRNILLSRGITARLGESVSASFRSVNAMVGSIGASDHSFLITGGSDCRIRFWDFAMPSKCYVSTGPDAAQPRPSFERIDYDATSRLMMCRQPPTPSLNEVESSKMPRKLLQGTKRIENSHEDAITDLKVVRSGLLSCSRDCTVKLWR